MHSGAAANAKVKSKKEKDDWIPAFAGTPAYDMQGQAGQGLAGKRAKRGKKFAKFLKKSVTKRRTVDCSHRRARNGLVDKDTCL
jgi:hypothetical protein